jgi:signal transduction histidine kinase
MSSPDALDIQRLEAGEATTDDLSPRAPGPARPIRLVGTDGQLQVRAFLGQPAQPHLHAVQFYEGEGFLFDNVAHFVGAGLDAGEAVVIIATEAHRAAFAARLRLQGFDVAAAGASGQLTLLDARETLAHFMIGDQPDPERFRSVVGGTLEASRAFAPTTRVRAYGEMVDLLWREGNRPAAIQLETLWNELGQTQAFSLLCAYVMGNFNHALDREQFQEVCRTHSHVIPAESYSQIERPEHRLREISLLQQRARSLEHEIERRKELERELRRSLAREKQAREAAERSVHYNEMFAGMLGHDLRNPLSAITTGANYIARMDAAPRATKAASRILSSAERMSRMIDQLLDFTRIRVGGGLVLNHTRLDLAELCARIKEELEAAQPDCKIALETRGYAVGQWDYDRMLQVLSNLVGNAIHHGAHGCRITVQSDGTQSAEVVLVVHNQGVVSAEMLPMMFEPFRGTPKRTKTSGLGLGLFITQQIISAHGGTIEVLSTELEGTTFRVRLPRTPHSALHSPPGALRQ